LIEIVVALLNKQIDFNFGVLGLFIGSGLLRLSRGWRTCALVFVWIELILLPIIGLIGMVMRPPPDVKLFSQTMASAPAEIGAVVVLVAFFVAVWQYWALTRPDVRRLFGLTPDEE
jgi:hypothetical protein